VVLYVCIGCVV